MMMTSEVVYYSPRLCEKFAEPIYEGLSAQDLHFLSKLSADIVHIACRLKSGMPEA
jgi:hypothetical protein